MLDDWVYCLNIWFKFIPCVKWLYECVTWSSRVLLYCPDSLPQSILFIFFLALNTVCNYLLFISVPFWSGNSMKIRARLTLFHALHLVLRAVLATWQVIDKWVGNHLLTILLNEFNLNKHIFPEGLGNRLLPRQRLSLCKTKLTPSQ